MPGISRNAGEVEKAAEPRMTISSIMRNAHQNLRVV
jgi:hypothetical protein